MAITIKNNTTKLQNLKNKVNALPDKEEGGTVSLLPTTAGASNILSGKDAYLVDENGNPTLTTGTMSNYGSITKTVGLTGENSKTLNGYVNELTVMFSTEINEEIDTQADLIAQIKQKLIEKGAHL